MTCVTQNRMQQMLKPVDLTGPEDTVLSVPIFWPGGHGLIIPGGVLTNGSTIDFMFAPDNTGLQDVLRSFTQYDIMRMFTFWLPRGYITLIASAPLEGDSILSVNAWLFGVDEVR